MIGALYQWMQIAAQVHFKSRALALAEPQLQMA
jgi:hypothetical protein